MGFYAFIAIGIGAASGAWLRWGLGILLNPVFPTLPFGTLAANLLGGFLMGMAMQFLLEHALLAPEIRLFITTGFLGGLTTFSTFCNEALGFLQSGHFLSAFTYAASGMLSGLLGIALGMAIGQRLTKGRVRIDG